MSDFENYPGKLYRFEDLPCCTMTVIVNYDADTINLPAIFLLLPVTKLKLPTNKPLLKKQKKIVIPPELNIPNEILSMRFSGNTRGIVRSEVVKNFLHSILMDIGTTEKIISPKLSRGKIEFTGVTNYEVTLQISNLLLNYIKRDQENILLLRRNLPIFKQIIEYIYHCGDFPTIESFEYFVENQEKITESFVSKEETQAFIFNEVAKNTKGKETITERKIIIKDILLFLREKYDGSLYHGSLNPDIILFLYNFASNPNLNLYTGTLKIDKYKGEMANILFNLGYPVILNQLATVMNSSPFVCKFTNASNAFSVNISYFYIKYDKDTYRVADYSIRVNHSGHVTYSGPDRASMRDVYNAFMKRIVENYAVIYSNKIIKRKISIKHDPKIITKQEWKNLIRTEKKLFSDLINDRLPITKTSIFDSEEDMQLLKRLKNKKKTKASIKFEFFLELMEKKNRGETFEGQHSGTIAKFENDDLNDNSEAPTPSVCNTENDDHTAEYVD